MTYYVMQQYSREEPAIKFFNDQQEAWEYYLTTIDMFDWPEKPEKQFNLSTFRFEEKGEYEPPETFPPCNQHSGFTSGWNWYVEMGVVTE